MSTNISKQKRDDLLRKIQEIRTYISTAEQDENTARLLSYLSDLAKDVNGKKYGLVFEEHREEIDEVLDTHTPVLTENADLFIDNGGQMNFLIEGDNLASLKLLEKTHKGKIDLIYIDPPYNTGNRDFVYDDKFIVRDDTFRHSQWISFIRKRLEIAHNLMSDNASIFISIDDNEIANLRLLCDQIFGEENFINQITLLCNPKGRSQDKYFATCHEYLLVYSKRILPKGSFSIIKSKNQIDKDYDQLDENGQYRLLELRNTHREFDRSNRPNLYYPFFIAPNDDTSTVSLVADSVHTEEVYPLWPDGHEGCWTWGAQLAQKDIHLLVGKKIRGRWKIFRKAYAVTDGEVARQKMFSIWKEPEYYTEKGQLEFGKVFLGSNKNDFPQPKSVEYIKAIIRMMQNKKGTVLDFFAGSGTTAQSVMELNAEDDGRREFIVCTNNEANICRNITYPRIKTIITGFREDNSKYSDGINASLKYYKVDYIPIGERMYYEYADELLLHIRELVELENGINFTGNDEIAIVLTDEELAAFTANIGTNCRKLYMGHDILPDEEQQAIIAEHGVEISIIPDYYYRDLQEGKRWN